MFEKLTKTQVVSHFYLNNKRDDPCGLVSNGALGNPLVICCGRFPAIVW